jgi:hypothetical protein
VIDFGFLQSEEEFYSIVSPYSGDSQSFIRCIPIEEETGDFL